MADMPVVDHSGVPDASPEVADLLPALDPLVEQVRAAHPDRPQLLRIFADALANTLSTTVRRSLGGRTFVATGDIPAMWLRDSAAQVETYLRAARDHDGLRDALIGVVRHQADYLAVDAYANSFNERARTGDPGVDEPPPGPWVWERKYELDSLCYPVRLAHRLWRRTGTTDHLDDATLAMLRTVVDTMTIEQDHDASSGYWFGRGVSASDTLPHDGKGSPVARTGMVWSGFRPSDDACAFHYLVPANMFAVVSLAQLAETVTEVYADIELADRASTLAGRIRIGIDEHAVIEHPVHASIWAYEVDGLGNRLLADDANTPSLLSAPYLGYCAPDDPVYLATRAFVLSAENPYYYSGSAASGVGSPHTPDRYIWPMGLAMAGLTSTDRAEQDALLETLLATTAGTGLMHEGFDADDPGRFTRPWFGWSNSLFAEFVLRLTDSS